eukprot:sb/3467691/
MPAPELCPNGTYSLPGWVSCLVCEAGTFSLAEGEGCQACPVGWFCNGIDEPQPCEEGTYGPVEGLNICEVCPPGFAWACQRQAHKGLSQAISPALGEQPPQSPHEETKKKLLTKGGSRIGDASPGLVACCLFVFKLVNWHSRNKREMEMCENGRYEKDGVCVICPIGHYCPSPAISAPIECQPGTYQTTTGYISDGTAPCTPCEAGYNCTGGEVIGLCPEGSYSAQGTEICSECPIGYECSGNGNEAPTPCASGTYASVPGSGSCDVCPSKHECSSTTATPCLDNQG